MRARQILALALLHGLDVFRRADLLPLGARLQHRLDLVPGHLFVREVYVHVGEAVPFLEQDEEAELHDAELPEHAGLVLPPLVDLRLLMRGQVGIEDAGGVVVGHVVIFPVVVILALDDARTIDTGDVLPVLVKLDEGVEAEVDEGEEVGHAEQGLQVDPEDERQAPSRREDAQRVDHPVHEHAVLELLRHLVLAGVLEVPQRAEARHVQQNPVLEEHEIAPRRPVQVPLVEGVPLATVQLVVDVHVRRGEVAGDGAEENPEAILEEVANGVPHRLLVHHRVVPLLVRQSVRSSHGASAQADPDEVVRVDHPPRQPSIAHLPCSNRRIQRRTRTKRSVEVHQSQPSS
eukprot:scaffold5340_cov257-Pinguiococcus_pyrenoidosus.AAC.7